jgi:hypothetical protein
VEFEFPLEGQRLADSRRFATDVPEVDVLEPNLFAPAVEPRKDEQLVEQIP